MIKINLKPGAQVGGNPSLGGKSKAADKLLSSVTVENFNPVVWITCLLLAFGPSFWFEQEWKDKENQIKAIVSKKKKKLKSLDAEIVELRKYQETRDKLKLEGEVMQEGLQVINEVLSKHNNPMKVLNYVAENIPKDVWLEEVKISKDKITITGYALNFKDIDVFLRHLNESLFFEQSARLKNYVTKDLYKYKRRVEQFIVTASVARYQ